MDVYLASKSISSKGQLGYGYGPVGRCQQNRIPALNAATDAKLWSYAAGSSVVAGATIVGADVYWGSGYSRSAAATGGENRFFAFSENGK